MYVLSVGAWLNQYCWKTKEKGMILAGTALDKVVLNLKADEGYRRFVYTDTTGNKTIGYGHNLDANGISEPMAEIILRDDMANVEHDLANSFTEYSSLDDARKGVLLQMAFNMGVGGVMAFTHMLAAIQAQDWVLAANAITDSLSAKEHPLRSQKWAHCMQEGVI
jgi:lysozyme